MSEAPIIRRIPPDMKPLDDSEFEAAMDGAFDLANQTIPSISLNMSSWQRALLTLKEERDRVGQLRFFIATSGSNMKKPESEAKVLSIADAMAMDLLLGGIDDIEKAMSILTVAYGQVSLSMAGKLDLDVAEWGERDREHQEAKAVIKAIAVREGLSIATTDKAEG